MDYSIKKEKKNLNVIIILNYNDFETTNTYLDLIENFKVLDRIVVVDNCSTDSSFERLKIRETEKVSVIKTESNEGYSHGNNFGIKFAQKQFHPRNIIISNPDIIIEEKSIIRICEFLNTNENVAMATGLVHDLKGKVSSNFATKLPTYFDYLCNSSVVLSKIYNKLFSKGMYYNSRDLKKAGNNFYTDLLPGCFFIIKNKIIKEINYFDERTFLYGEEAILSYKIKDKGYDSVVLINEKIIHLQGVSINKSISSWKKKSKILEESRIIYLKNYLKVNKLQIIIFKMLFNVGKYELFFIRNLKQMKDKTTH